MWRRKSCESRVARQFGKGALLGRSQTEAKRYVDGRSSVSAQCEAHLYRLAAGAVKPALSAGAAHACWPSAAPTFTKITLLPGPGIEPQVLAQHPRRMPGATSHRARASTMSSPSCSSMRRYLTSAQWAVLGRVAFERIDATDDLLSFFRNPYEQYDPRSTGNLPIAQRLSRPVPGSCPRQ